MNILWRYNLYQYHHHSNEEHERRQQHATSIICFWIMTNYVLNPSRTQSWWWRHATRSDFCTPSMEFLKGWHLVPLFHPINLAIRSPLQIEFFRLSQVLDPGILVTIHPRKNLVNSLVEHRLPLQYPQFSCRSNSFLIVIHCQLSTFGTFRGSTIQHNPLGGQQQGNWATAYRTVLGPAF